MIRRYLDIEIIDIPHVDALWNMPDDAQLRLEIEDGDVELAPQVVHWWLIDIDAEDIEPSREERVFFETALFGAVWPSWMARAYERAIRRSNEAAIETRYGL